MTIALVSKEFISGFGAEFKAIAERAGKTVEFMTLPAQKGARLINIGRGEVVDEAAFIEAMRSGHLAGAAIDAFCHEPLPADSPLWDLPNIIISPHNASASKGNEKRCAEMFIANFGHQVRGEPMFNVQRVA